MAVKNYWHMQMHPTAEPADFGCHIDWILEHLSFIGMGEWEGGRDTINTFVNEMAVNDIVAIKRGGKLVALVQVIGDAYFVPRESDADPRTQWMENRRPVRVLDWAINGETLPQRMGTLNRCANQQAETTKIIRNWHARVNESLKKRGIPIEV